MATCVQPVGEVEVSARSALYSLVYVVLAIALPVLAGLAWHRASDNPAWPLLRSSLNLCELQEAPLSPISPDGLSRVHVVRATCFGRFDETMVFIAGANDPWSLDAVNPNRAILEVAGDRSLDAVTWQDSSVLQLWFQRDALPHQLHHLDRTWGAISIQSLTSAPAPGAERLDY